MSDATHLALKPRPVWRTIFNRPSTPLPTSLRLKSRPAAILPRPRVASQPATALVTIPGMPAAFGPQEYAYFAPTATDPLIAWQPSDAAAIVRRAIPIAILSSAPIEQIFLLQSLAQTYSTGRLTAYPGECHRIDGSWVEPKPEPGKSPKFSPPALERCLGEAFQNRPLTWNRLGTAFTEPPKQAPVVVPAAPPTVLPTVRDEKTEPLGPAQARLRMLGAERLDGQAPPRVASCGSVSVVSPAQLPRLLPSGKPALDCHGLHPLPATAVSSAKPSAIDFPAAIAPPKRVGAPSAGHPTVRPRVPERGDIRQPWLSEPIPGHGPTIPPGERTSPVSLTLTPRSEPWFATTITDASTLAVPWRLANCYKPRDRQIHMIQTPQPPILRHWVAGGFRPATPEQITRWRVNWHSGLHHLDFAGDRLSSVTQSGPLSSDQELRTLSSAAPAFCDSPPPCRTLGIWQPAPIAGAASSFRMGLDTMAASPAPLHPLGVRPAMTWNISVAPAAADWRKPSNSYDRSTRSSDLLSLVQEPKSSVSSPAFLVRGTRSSWGSAFQGTDWSAAGSTSTRVPPVVLEAFFEEAETVKYPIPIQRVTSNYLIRRLNDSESVQSWVLAEHQATTKPIGQSVRTIGLRPRVRLPQNLAHLT